MDNNITWSFNPSPAEPGHVLPANRVAPDQWASKEANWSESALFTIKYVNLYQQSGSNNLIDWKLEWAWHDWLKIRMGVAS